MQSTDMVNMRGDSEQPHQCGLCKKTFRQKSSLIRHSKKCSLQPTPSGRQKACKGCTAAKARCDLVRPTCFRCAARGVACTYSRAPAQPAHPSHTPDHHALTPQDGLYAGGSTMIDFTDLEADDTMTSGFFSHISSEDTVDLSLLDPSLGQVSLDLTHTPNSGPPPPSPEELDSWIMSVVTRPLAVDPEQLVKHSMRTVFRVLRSWPRMLAKGFQVPPMIHFLQFKDGPPRPMANCITLCNMWSGQCDSAAAIVEDAVRKEVDIILGKYRTYDEPTLLAAQQAVVIYLLLLIFPTPNQTSQSIISKSLFTQIQTMGYYVASTGLILPEESTHVRPAWQTWAYIEAKRRAMCSLYLVHWAYSVYHEQLDFDCRELSRMPGPAAKFLWSTADETSWNSLYNRWLAQWDGQDFLFAEFACIDQEIVMNRRAETWLEDADELGILVLSLVHATEVYIIPRVVSA
ncbi:hypothetical protein BJ170DRAFT_275965 [Xylariales sp. AK1849]|nr:hypothetical protein BJ170DRAFT_275965 [Xylariales sp. AK1849]